MSSVDKSEAVELVERWLRAQGFQIGEAGGRKVDLSGVRLVPEG
ncbi:hypothetical protein FHU35_1862 [Saccharopolyspora dendranthemae]|uniref:Uncharacterized protein n=1 Tax=Saccharopolyspora dendranthemae TaxID=1181886 RepID=A0A561TX03_9PSEU|nr:hypothetical protein FHU35_1862 [Saccharopolyspora dendranthemae]